MNRRDFLADFGLAAAGAVVLPALGGCGSLLPRSHPEAFRWIQGMAPQTIAVVGDMQRASSLHRRIGHLPCDEERIQIVDAIAADRPGMLLMLGDQVLDGDSSEDWAYFDYVTAPLRDAGIYTRALLGNHDYGTLEGSNTDQPWYQNFARRFPHQADSLHGVTRLGQWAIVTVDSNYPDLRPAFLVEQEKEYRDILAKLDADSDVIGVIVASHHPPYSNGGHGFKIAQSLNLMLDQVREAFAVPFMEAKKTRLYLSGHVHSYQRFVSKDKMFVVSGGGGGNPHPVDISAKRRFRNDAEAMRALSIRPFHYLQVRILHTIAHVEVKMLRQTTDPDRKWEFYVGDRFAV